MFKVPGKSFAGPLPPLSDDEVMLREELVVDVAKLAGEIGEKNIQHYENLAAAADYIRNSLTEAGYVVQLQGYEVQGVTCYNLSAEITGIKQPDRIVIVGAHYDSVWGSPGANDNISAVAAFVFFVNEEPPFYHTDQMGSLVYAKECRARGENIIGMLSLETIGYYSERPNSQRYPFPFSLMYPGTGNFIGFVSNLSSRKFLHKVVGVFRKKCKFPSQAGAIPEFVSGISWSDHWSFWQEGYPAIMVTDTAPFRYPHYHGPQDTPDKIDYERLARVVCGLGAVVAESAQLTNQ
jgi:Zn-dependent M28 family amino/carboxypeptidase